MLAVKSVELLYRLFCSPSRKRLFEKLEDSRKEIDRLTQALIDPKILDIGIKDGGLNMDLKVPDWAVRAMADSFAESLRGAPNWSTYQIGPMPSTEGMLFVTVRRADGSTPEETVGKLREEVAHLEDRCKEVGSDRDKSEADAAAVRQRYCDMLDQRDDANRVARRLSQSNADHIKNSMQLRRESEKLVNEASEAHFKLLLRNHELDGVKAQRDDLHLLVESRDKEIVELKNLLAIGGLLGSMM